MTGIGIIDFFLIFVKFIAPAIVVCAVILMVWPNVFVQLEKKLAQEFGPKPLRRRTVKILEKENFALQEKLLRLNRAIGLLCLLLAVIVFISLAR